MIYLYSVLDSFAIFLYFAILFWQIRNLLVQPVKIFTSALAQVSVDHFHIWVEPHRSMEDWEPDLYPHSFSDYLVAAADPKMNRGI